jgi:ubiquinone/menaquinone biosynthesis C-methylase UbiE
MSEFVPYAMSDASDEYEGPLARSYDALYGVMRDPSGDAAFYRGLAEESGGPVLELGCGTGRVLLPIAALGIPCVGVDASPAMLTALRAKRPPPNLELIEGRMESVDLGERRFRLVTCPFRAFQHLLDVPSQLAALANVRRHLAPGAAFVFDVFDPKLAWLAAPAETERLEATFTLDGVETRRFGRTRNDLGAQILEVTFRFEPPQSDGNTTVRLRWFYRYELEHLLARAGFTELTVYGGFDRRPWRPEGETVIVARAP